MGHGRLWTEDEVRHALALYLCLDFGRIHARNADVVRLAETLGRTPNAVALKLTNLAALDESLPRKGMSNVSAVDRQVWSEFLTSPDGVLRAHVQQQGHFATMPPAHEADLGAIKEGRDVQIQAWRRVGQDFFRTMILNSYRRRCALTGIEDERLLVASHIVAWSDDASLRLVPSNGICLNALHDRAFDRHLIAFDEDYRLVVAPDVPEATRQLLLVGTSDRLVLPQRFLPDQRLLERHRLRFRERRSTVG